MRRGVKICAKHVDVTQLESRSSTNVNAAQIVVVESWSSMPSHNPCHTAVENL